MDKNTLYIGWGEEDITPETSKLISLDGQYYTRLTRNIHSRLKFVAIAVKKDGDYFLEGTMDNVGMSDEYQDLVRARVKELIPELDVSKLFLNAIHTHSAPSIALEDRSFDFEKYSADAVLSNHEYVDYTVPILAKAFADAWNSAAPAGIARGFGNARIGHCRRAVYKDGTAEMYGDTTRPDFIGMEAGEDSGVDMLFTTDATGKRTGMILNVACPSQVMESTYQVSSDFAGATRELLKQEYGDDFHTLYWISPAGCQSPRDLVRHYATEPDCWHASGVAELSRRLFNAVKNAVVEPIDFSPVLKHTISTVELPRRRVLYQDYLKAVAEYERLIAIQPEQEAFKAFCDETHANEKIDGPGPYDSKLHHFVLIKNSQAIIQRYKTQDNPPVLTFEMHAIRLGDCAMANNPFELYLYYGQIIKARSKAVQTFLVQISGGASLFPGYLPSPEAEKFGGYGGCVINGEVGSEGGYKLADETVAAINKLF